MTPQEAYEKCRAAVRREAARWTDLERADAEQEAWCIILSKLHTYSTSKGSPDAWAEEVARNAIARAADQRGSLIRTPVYFAKAARRAARIDAKALARHGRPATADELETAGTRRYGARETDAPPVSLDEPCYPCRPRGWSRHDMTPSSAPTPEALAIGGQDSAALHAALAHLEPSHRQAVVMAYGLDGEEPRTEADIADVLRTTPREVRGMIHASLWALRDLAGLVHVG